METKERIINLLSQQLGMDTIEIKENSLIVEDLGMDSLDVVETVMNIEQEFGLRIDDSAIPDIKTVGDIVEMVEKMRLGR